MIDDDFFSEPKTLMKDSFLLISSNSKPWDQKPLSLILLILI